MPVTTIVIPCYNEQDRLKPKQFIEFAETHPWIDLLFVNDGSSDDTLELLRATCQNQSNLSVLNQESNAGKAEAVRLGVLAASAKQPHFIGFWDADLATPLDAIVRCESLMHRREDIRVVLGSRIPLMGHFVERDAQRQRMSIIFASMIRRFTPLRMNDTQCGAKLFRWCSDIESAFARPFSVNWIFDVELFLRLHSIWKDTWNHHIYELPLESWTEIAGSKIRSKDCVLAIREFISLAWSYRGQRQDWLSIAKTTPPTIVAQPSDKRSTRMAA